MSNGYGMPQNQARQAPPPPQQNRPPMSYSKPPSKAYQTIIIVGIILLLVGCIILNITGFMIEPDQSDEEYEDDMDKYSEDHRSWEKNQEYIKATGTLLSQIAVIIVTLGLIMGAIKDKDQEALTKLGMLIAVGFIIGFRIITYLY